MDSLAAWLGRALRDAEAGGRLVTPPGMEVARSSSACTGLTSRPRPARRRVVVIETAPGIPGHEVHFVTLDDGAIVVDEDVLDGVLGPLADAVERSVPPPYSAEAARQDGDAWACGANPVAIATLPAALEGDHIEQSSYAGEQTYAVDGAPAVPIGELIEIGNRHVADFSLVADRLEETTWVVRAESL